MGSNATWSPTDGEVAPLILLARPFVPRALSEVDRTVLHPPSLRRFYTAFDTAVGEGNPS